MLAGLDSSSFSISHNDLSEVCRSFLRKGVETVVITLGEKGAFHSTIHRLSTDNDGVWIPAQEAKVIDTTAAGDTFVGAYALRIASALENLGTVTGAVIGQAVEFAILAAARTIEKPGAQSAIPWLDDLDNPEAILPELAPPG